MASSYALGFDYGTESVRVLVVDTRTGRVAGQASRDYAHGVIDRTLPGSGAALPADYALQDPDDWLSELAAASKAALAAAGVRADEVVGIGVDFTSCTMMPALADGTPLCKAGKWASVPLAWPKLWKHHGAKRAVDRINAVARERNDAFLPRYGGTIGIEWFFPKVLETLWDSPDVYAATQVWLEAGDWLVWQLTSGPWPRCKASELVRSTCQAGYKGMWNKHSGFPSREYLAAVDQNLADVVTEKMPGRLLPPGARVGVLTPAAAELLGLRAGIPVAAAIIDAHAGVPGSGVAEAGTLVMVMGTSSCHMMNSRVEVLAPGIAGVVEEGILPGFYGYETGQASVGDAFAWLVRTFGLSHEEMNRKAALLAPGSGGVLALDWLNGCRTPLMDACLSGGFAGITLGTRPEQMYRALMEATAMGVRWIVETLRDGGVTVERFVASGGLPVKSPVLMQIYADVLGAEITLAESDQSVALGAAILGCIAAGPEATGYPSVTAAVKAMARQRTDIKYVPDRKNAAAYEKLYTLYRQMGQGLSPVMRELRQLA